MNNKVIIFRLLGVAFLLQSISACNKSPEVFSLNNFTSVFTDSGTVQSVSQFSIKGITGYWSGMEHLIKIEPYSINNVDLYTAELIDTGESLQGSIDTTVFTILFFTVADHPFAEVISQGGRLAAHDFMLPASTYFKINKLTPDTIIVQMPQSKFTSAYMKANNFNYFIPDDYKKEKEFPVYITEQPNRLADLLNILCTFPGAFQVPDTIIRKH